MKRKNFWTRPRKDQGLRFFGTLACMVIALLIQQWRYALVLLCIVAIGGLIAFLLKFLRREDENISITGMH